MNTEKVADVVAEMGGYLAGSILTADPDTWTDRLTAAHQLEVKQLKEELGFQQGITGALLPYQERAIKAEAELARLRASQAALIEAAQDILDHCPAGSDWRMANGWGYTLPTGHVDDLRAAIDALATQEGKI